MPMKAIFIRFTPQFVEGSISVINGSVRVDPNVRLVSSPKKMYTKQRVAIAATRQNIKSSGSRAFARTGITIPIPSKL